MQNVGVLDRAVRIVVGATILAFAFVGPQTPWAYLGFIPLATGFIGICPLYALFGFRTGRALNT